MEVIQDKSLWIHLNLPLNKNVNWLILKFFLITHAANSTLEVRILDDFFILAGLKGI